MTDLPPAYGAPITLAIAKIMMAAAEAEARKNNWHVSFAIIDSGGNLVQFQRMERAPLATAEVAQAKAKSALGFCAPSKMLQDMLTAGGMGLCILSIPDLTALEGGLPIFANGACIGAIGVSGVQAHEDAQIAQAGVDALG